MNKTLFALSLTLTSAACWAQQAPTPAIDPPPPPPPMQSGESIEPEIRIVETERGVIHQYRLEGRVYMVKIIPAAGEPYYLIDTNGDGELDSQAGDIKNISVPQWVIFSW